MPVWLSEDSEPLFTGAVLDKGEMSYTDDSDFYAVVWNENEQRVMPVSF